MNVDEYESLPTASVGVHMTAGAIAGIMEHTIMYPLDSVKTRMQALTPGPGGGGGGGGGSMFAVFSRMIRQEGVWRPIRGIGVMVAGAGPAHALYFSCYEFLKNKMLSSKFPSQFNHLIYGASGCVATLLHDGVMNPAEVVKQRLQMYNSPYRSISSCIRHVYKTEGVVAFYRSYTTQLAMNVPFQSIHFIAYEFSQSMTNPEHKYNPYAHIVSGGMAGAIAAAGTTPLDVCKTLLNTQQGSVRPQGMVEAFKMVYRLGGVAGFFRGMTARILSQMPATAICWTTYESFKYILQKESGTSQTTESSKCEEGSNLSGTLQSPISRSTFQGSGLYFKKQAPSSVLLEVTRS
ncbi:mitoferrin-1-like [Belonocnema kinseyi]|uniref:mitoferrin-1-like n=1 Tax=Belonocnema kinseyi TaxID=2817044 RepID=UPI00143D7277|nr:mitoferrin-1-like [Belonocnema kinseyi]